jgi:hypothetical protein
MIDIKTLKKEVDNIENGIIKTISDYQNKYNITFPQRHSDSIIGKIDIDTIDVDDPYNYINFVNGTDIQNLVMMSLLKQAISQPNTTESIADVIDKCNNIFSIFKAHQITEIIEDDTWNICDHNCTTYDINENEIYFENTISLADINNDIYTEYLDDITTLFNNTFKNFKFKNKVIESDGNGIAFLIIRLRQTDKSIN